MADVSRGGVFNLKTAKLLIKYLALMGYNDLMLYMEDVYELPKYPYFGHHRGRYTLDELRELVEYGERFGVTLTPCIQTLGHLRSMLRWPCFASIRDTDDVLYVGKDETYEFLDYVFETLCSVFKTRRFNIGMDEAHSLGTGARLEKEGFVPKSELMRIHLKRIAELCKKHGIKPLIWSDMFFRPLNPDNEYYSADLQVPDEVINSVPEDFTLVYWEYYNCDMTDELKAIFDNMMAQHLRFNNPTAYAGCTWRWVGFAPKNAFSMLTSNYHVNGCLDNNIRDITMTSWSNDGSESSHFSAIPAVMLYAEKLYTGSRERLDISDALFDIFGLTLDDYLLLDEPNRVPGSPPTRLSQGKNPCKNLFYQDCLCGKMDAHSDPSYKAFYAELSKKLYAKKDVKRFGYLFEVLGALCQVLKTKATLSLDLRKAYLENDRQRLDELCWEIDTMIADLDVFTELFRKQWLKEYKMWGYENIEMRFGSVKERAIGTKKTVREYLNGELEAIEPLEDEVLYFDCRPADSEKNKIASIGHYLQCTPINYLL